MWKAWVAAAAVGIAAFAAVVLAGRDLVEPEPAETALVPVRGWAERAGQHCRDSMGAVRAELTSPRALETQEAQALRLYRETTRIEGALVAKLQALPGAPAEGAAAVEVLAAQHQRDRRTVAQLEQALDPALILREITAYERVAKRLQERFDALGVEGCVRYLDPASYG